MPEPTPPTDALPDGTALGPVTLAARDVGGLERFYLGALGLRRRGSGPGGELELGTDRAPLLRLRPAAGNARDPAAPGLFHLALLLPARAALGAWLRHALETHVALEGAADHAVSEAIYLRDPEGNGIEVYRDRPRASWRSDAGRVVMTTEPLDAQAVLREAGPDWTGMPAAARVGHVHLQVGSLDRSLAFYAGALGWPVTNDAFPGARFLGAGGYHHHLGLNTWNVRPGTPRDAAGPGLVGFEVALPSAPDLAAVERRLAAAGRDVRRSEGALDLIDPDGTCVHLTAGGSPR